MTIIVFRYFVIRNCGSGKLCADLKFTVLSASSPPINLFWSKVFAHLEALGSPFFGASPHRFALRILSALD